VATKSLSQTSSPKIPAVFHVSDAAPAGTTASIAEVFGAALKLGLTSFGGPIAHLGYFERTYVQERRWLSAADYAGIVGLCQLLPGPASSQVGFLIGYHRAGWGGALAAWVGFTLPSALLMYAFAQFASRVQGPILEAIVHGLMLTAVAVVVQAVWSMSRNLCPDLQRKAIALLAVILLLLHNSAAMQLTAMLVGAIGGWFLCRTVQPPAFTPPAGLNFRIAWILVAVFCGLLLVLPILSASEPHGPIALADVFYRAGALVFGGGHVVLPILRDALVPNGWISDDAFLTGYGFAQAIPGPLFTFAAYLGAVSAPTHAAAGWATIAVVAIFLPGLLLALAGLSLWTRLIRVPVAQASVLGVNAAVVGVLGAALYNPVWTAAVHSGLDVIVAVAGFLLLERWHTPPILVVALCVIVSVATVVVH
jgi:chromate transporter